MKPETLVTVPSWLWRGNSGLLIVRAKILCCSLALACSATWPANIEKPKTDSRKQQAQPDRRGTEDAPIFVNGEVTTKKDKADAAQEAKEREAKEQADAALVKYTGLLAVFTFLLFSFTAALWWVTLQLSRRAKRDGERQAVEMGKSINEAIRSASAMESVAEATNNNAILMQGVMHKQMRAYVAVDIGRATYQDANLLFEYSPILVNTGFTPAKNISYKITADILAAELPDDFVFKDYGNERDNDVSLAPRQQFIIRGIVRKRFGEGEVPAIMIGETMRLYAWGVVTYTDVFGGSWKTNFCHSVMFHRVADDEVKVNVLYHPTHNDST